MCKNSLNLIADQSRILLMWEDRLDVDEANMGQVGSRYGTLSVPHCAAGIRALPCSLALTLKFSGSLRLICVLVARSFPGRECFPPETSGLSAQRTQHLLPSDHAAIFPVPELPPAA
ncbi:hypothetical protein ACRRTK_010723 [Alexandromys fortis]